jgi:hypothetical protein
MSKVSPEAIYNLQLRLQHGKIMLSSILQSLGQELKTPEKMQQGKLVHTRAHTKTHVRMCAHTHASKPTLLPEIKSDQTRIRSSNNSSDSQTCF